MEAKTKNTKLNDDDLFTIVGADYQIHTPVLKKPNLWYRLKGKPIASIIILVLIIGGCIFAELIMNHDASEFYLEHLNEAPIYFHLFGMEAERLSSSVCSVQQLLR